MLTPPATITAAEYLAAERKSPERHEFFNGEILPVTGASRPHNLIANKISRLLGNVLDELDYAVYQSNMRGHNPVSESHSYPDVFVVQGAASKSMGGV